ncbi:hypothetical protein [Aquipuribacter sp. MA13-6]|uniref:hypothetical protein n=1 Tax=unclassified Aquipuribacter TaxID=2635084 RepID=UPI003EE9E002
MTGKVVVVHVGDQQGRLVLDVAAQEALAADAELAVLGVFRGLPRGARGRRRSDMRGDDGRLRELSLRRCSMQVGAARRALVARWPRLEVSATVLDGSRAESVGAVLSGTSLLVLEPRSSFSGDRRRADPLAALVRAGEVPTLLVPRHTTAGTGSRRGPVVVGLPPGADDELLRTATETARRHGCGLRCVRAADDPRGAVAALRDLTRRLPPVGARLGSRLAVETVTGYGDPARLVLQAAEDASRILLGGGLRRMLDGEGAGTVPVVVAGARCPVLVLPAGLLAASDVSDVSGRGRHVAADVRLPRAREAHPDDRTERDPAHPSRPLPEPLSGPAGRR